MIEPNSVSSLEQLLCHLGLCALPLLSTAYWHWASLHRVKFSSQVHPSSSSMSEEGSKDNPILIDIDIDYCCVCESKQANFVGPNCFHTPKCCNHCISIWSKKSPTCPYCRGDLHIKIELQVPHPRVELGIWIPANCKLPERINCLPSIARKKREIRIAIKDHLWLEKERAELNYQREFRSFDIDSSDSETEN